MAECYSFTARVIARRKDRLCVSPEEPDAFMDYLERVGLPRGPYWRHGECLIWLKNQKLIDAANGATRVRYSVEKRASRMFAVELEALP